MPKRKTPEEKPKDQFKRFLEVARELKVDESGDKVEREFGRLAKKQPPKRVERS